MKAGIRGSSLARQDARGNHSQRQHYPKRNGRIYIERDRSGRRKLNHAINGRQNERIRRAIRLRSCRSPRRQHVGPANLPHVAQSET